jgi:2-polyprenyl-3-methyl-5-hydroxy-6-metoxy-1,4-benzoquinol methylase
MGKSTLEAAISDSYYACRQEIERTHKQFMRSLVPSEQPLKILDVGCGTGLNALHLAQAGHQVVGIDLSPVAIAQFRQKGFEGHVCDIEAAPIPLPPEQFDLVYASEVIEHCADTQSFLKELNRMLKVGGLLFLSTPNSAFWPYRLLGLLGKTPTEYQHKGHVRFFSKRSLAAAITEGGFEIRFIAARNMYLLIGKRIGNPLAPILQAFGFVKEGRFATGDHFWQLSSFVPKASSFWSDTLIVAARKTASTHARGDRTERGMNLSAGAAEP